MKKLPLLNELGQDIQSSQPSGLSSSSIFATIAALMLGAAVNTAAAGERESLEQLRSTTTNLVNLLVQEGVLRNIFTKKRLSWYMASLKLPNEIFEGDVGVGLIAIFKEIKLFGGVRAGDKAIFGAEGIQEFGYGCLILFPGPEKVTLEVGHDVVFLGTPYFFFGKFMYITIYLLNCLIILYSCNEPHDSWNYASFYSQRNGAVLQKHCC